MSHIFFILFIIHTNNEHHLSKFRRGLSKSYNAKSVSILLRRMVSDRACGKATFRLCVVCFDGSVECDALVVPKTARVARVKKRTRPFIHSVVLNRGRSKDARDV